MEYRDSGTNGILEKVLPEVPAAEIYATTGLQFLPFNTAYQLVAAAGSVQMDDTPLTIVDPFKDASVLLKAKDDKSGKLLPGSTVNIGSGDKTILTLTTGSDGTASCTSTRVPAATSGSSR